MKRVLIDMNPLIYGQRAVYRCTKCLVDELLSFKDIEYSFLYIDYKNQKNRYWYDPDIEINKSVIRLPYRVLMPMWRTIHWPSIESFGIKTDLFYTNEQYFPPSNRIPIVATVHGLAYKVIPHLLPAKTVNALSRGLEYLLANADEFIAVSETTAKELIELIGIEPERIHVVTHGVDPRFKKVNNLSAASDAIKHVYSLSAEYILYVGAIGKHKNVLRIVEAFQRISRNVEHNLVLAGPADSAWEDVNEFVNRNQLQQRVYLLNHISNTVLLNYLYNLASVFIFPSFYEGWTSPPLEAMAAGTPVIVSNRSSLPETVGDAALKIDPESIDQIAESILKVIKDKQLARELSLKGLEHASKHSWKNSAFKLKKVLHSARQRISRN